MTSAWSNQEIPMALGGHTVLAITLVIALLSGCTTPRLAGIARGGSVSIVVEKPGASIVIKNELIGEDAGKGSAVGALAGGIGGLSCGPLALLCVPAGILVGSGSGAVVGAMVGVAEGLPADKFERLSRRIQAYSISHDVRAVLQTQIIESARHRWIVSSDSPGAQIHVSLESLSLGLTRGERIAVTARVAVQVRGSTSGFNRQDYKQFLHQGRLSHLDVWTDESTDFVEENIRSAFQHIAAQIVADIAYQ